MPTNVSPLENVCLHGEQQAWVRVGELTEDGLTPNNNDVVLLGDGAGRSNDMLKLEAPHTRRR
jgi:hypothetical protein